MQADTKLKLLKELYTETKFCIPDIILEDIVKVVGKYVLSNSQLSEKEITAIIKRALQ